MSDSCNCYGRESVLVPMTGIGLDLEVLKNALPSSGGGSGSGVDYSETEQWSGQRWIDGRKIYQKTIVMGALANNTRKNVVHGIENLDFCIKFAGVAAIKAGETNGPTCIPLGYMDSVSVTPKISFGIDKVNAWIRTKEDWSYVHHSFITAWYVCTDR